MKHSGSIIQTDMVYSLQIVGVGQFVTQCRNISSPRIAFDEFLVHVEQFVVFLFFRIQTDGSAFAADEGV